MSSSDWTTVANVEQHGVDGFLIEAVVSNGGRRCHRFSAWGPREASCPQFRFLAALHRLASETLTAWRRLAAFDALRPYAGLGETVRDFGGGWHQGDMPDEPLGGLIELDPETNVGDLAEVSALLESQLGSGDPVVGAEVARCLGLVLDLLRQHDPDPWCRPRLASDDPNAGQDATDKGADLGDEDLSGFLDVAGALPDKDGDFAESAHCDCLVNRSWIELASEEQTCAKSVVR
ncbi:MAG TPA: hypothetical protein PKU97_04695, partial [Kofleriaceae bacterium]|nr:hypothetical protein [Kofleriaceae bacterium]